MIEYHLCVWEGLMVQDDLLEDFINYLETTIIKEQFGLSGYFLERLTTNPNLEKGEEGGRPDILFIIFGDREKDREAIQYFLMARFAMEDVVIRLFDDVVGGGNHTIYPEQIIHKYTYQLKDIFITKMTEHGLHWTIEDLW